MNKEWNLDAIYAGFNDPNFAKDQTELDKSIEELNELAKNLSKHDAKTNLENYKKISTTFAELASKSAGYASLRQSANTKDAEAATWLGRLINKFSATTIANTTISNYIGCLDNLDEVINSSEELKEIAFMLKRTKESHKYLLDDKVEDALSRYNISGGKAWSDLQSYLTSGVEVDYNGEKTTLSYIRSLANSHDAKVRKDAYEAELACYEKIKDAVAFSLNSIKMQVISESKLRGYESPLDKVLFESNMKKETLDALMEAIKEYLPKFQEYLKVKAEVLGHKNGLPWYDLFAPMGSNTKKYTTEETKEYLVNIFSKFNPDLAKMVETAFDNAWIDFYPRDGKVGGAFCAGVPSLKESRVLTNFDGNFSDVVTLAHELGHGYHNYVLRNNSILNNDYSMPVAETASTFNENVVMNAAISSEKDDSIKLSLIESQLQDATQIICDIYSRFLFESKVFENRENSFMFADELSEIMLDAQKQAYGDGLDSNVLHKYMWINKSHYYSAGLSFYNFPYAFGGLFARGLYALYEKEGKDFIPKYNALLKATPVMTVEDVAKIADIDLTDKSFWEMGLKSFAEEIDLFKELVRK